MKLSFTTLGCPQWNLETICRRGHEYGYEAIDFRGLQETLDVTTLPAFNAGVGQTRRMINDAGLLVSGISTSITVCDDKKRTANLEEARRTIPVALGLGCQNVRVFGGGDVEKSGRTESAQVGRDCIEAILALEGASELHWLFETHDHWIRSEDCRLLVDAIANPAFGILWDIGHTPRMGGETPAYTYGQLGKWIAYTHLKDAVYEPGHPQAMGDGWRYVPPGEGTVPLAEAIKVLQAGGYKGYLVLEHEKRWHPELPEPEIMFPKYVQWAHSLGV